MKTSLLPALLLLALGALPFAARAQFPALDFGPGGPGIDYYQGASYSLGWRFTTQQDVTVTDLGFYDDLKDGLHADESHPVGIFDVETKQLLGSTTVFPSDPLSGYFRYHAVTPFLLPAGRSYYVMTVTGRDHYAYNSTDLLLDPSITFDGTAVNYAKAVTNGRADSSSPLFYPDTYSPGLVGDFGPGFRLANAGASGFAAVDFPTGVSRTDANDNSFSMGYLFSPKKEIALASLGFYDDNKDGFKQTHVVGIFEAATRQQVALTQITSADPVRRFFRYHSIPPVRLQAGIDYVIMAINGADSYATGLDGVLQVNDAITFKGGALNTVNVPALDIAFPNLLGEAVSVRFGPTFEILPDANSTPVVSFSQSTATLNRATGRLREDITVDSNVKLSKTLRVIYTVNAANSDLAPGQDFAPRSGVKKLGSADAEGADLNFRLLSDKAKNRKAITLKLRPGEGYTVGEPSKLKIKIVD